MSIAIILAAGKGTRMKSHLPKPIVPFMGKPIVQHIIENFQNANIEAIYLVVGHGANEVEKTIGDRVQYILQKEQKGTAHAVSQVQNANDWNHKNVFVFVGDSPLVSSDTIKSLEEHHKKTQASCTFLTATFPIDLPYARVIKDSRGKLIACIEEKNANQDQLKIRELLSSHFIFKGTDLFKYLPQIEADKLNGEYYLTDIIGLLLKNKLKVETLLVDRFEELVGLNTPEDLQWAEKSITLTSK
jgi:bifunctional N-acetylglucosamine-1-phosphate-uridyltransferase/glucosamine-1-phosphate-acetyltransferase GlmU-like protein